MRNLKQVKSASLPAGINTREHQKHLGQQLILSQGKNEIPIIGIFEQTLFMAKNTSILLGAHFDEFIQSEVSSGRYGSASEVIRSALRLLEAQEQQKKELVQALVAGEKSGFDDAYDPDIHLKSLQRQKSK